MKPSGVSFMRDGRQPLDEGADADPVGSDHGGEGRLQALHAEGDPRAAARACATRCSAGSRSRTGTIHLEEIALTDEELRRADRMQIVACGTSWHAGHVGKFLIEQLAKIPVEVDYASEYRYRKPLLDDRCLSRLHQPVGRDRGHARRRARVAVPGAPRPSPSATCAARCSRGNATERSTRTPAPRSGSPRRRRSRARSSRWRSWR